MRLPITYERALAENPEIVQAIDSRKATKGRWFYDVHIAREGWELLTAPDIEALDGMARKYLAEDVKVKLSLHQGKDDWVDMQQFDVSIPEYLVAHYVTSFTMLRDCEGFEAMRAAWQKGSKALVAAAIPYKDDPKFVKFVEYTEKMKRHP